MIKSQYISRFLVNQIYSMKKQMGGIERVDH